MNAASAASAAADLAVASAEIATAAIVGIAATVRRAVRAKMKRLPPQRPRSKPDGHGCKHPAPPVLPPPEDLPVHRHECAEDRLQGREAAGPLRVGARQD